MSPFFLFFFTFFVLINLGQQSWASLALGGRQPLRWDAGAWRDRTS
jgi:hypothetical protein